MKNRGVVGRINSKQGRVSAFSTVGHGTGLPGAYTSNSLLLSSSSLSLSLSVTLLGATLLGLQI